MLFDKNESGSDEEVEINAPKESKSQSSLEEEVEDKIVDSSENMLPGSFEDENSSENVTLEDVHEQNKRIIKLLKELREGEENTNGIL